MGLRAAVRVEALERRQAEALLTSCTKRNHRVIDAFLGRLNV